jgi:hypothetical protein
MKLLLLLVLVFSPYYLVWGQTARYISAQELEAGRLAATPAARVFIDFEVKNQPNLTREELNGIDLGQIENHRLENMRAEFIDTRSGFTIVVYSADEATRNKTNLLLNSASPQHNRKEDE